MTTIRRRVLVEFSGDSKELQKALDQIQIETRDTADEFKDMASTSAKALDTIGLGAENQIPRLQRMANSFQGLTGKLGQGLGAIQNIAKGMAPWNQALNLAGKAVNFLDSGLSAAAKKYPAHAKEIEALRGSFTGLKEDVMAVVGVMTVELLRPVDVLGELKKAVDGVDASFARASFLGGFEKGKNRGQFFRGDDETANPLSNLASAFDGFKASLKGGVDYWNTGGTSFIDSYVEGMKKTAAETKKAREEAAAFAKELRDQAAARAFLRTATTSEGGNVARTDTVGRQLGWAPPGSLGVAADSISRDEFGRDAERGALDRISQDHFTNKWFADLNKFQAESAGRKSFLEAAFGPVDEINAHDLALKGLQITFGGLTTAVNSSMQAWISGSMSLGLAIKKGIGDALAGVASQMAIESLKHGAFALGSLAFFDFGGAAKHGAAAAAFGAGAVAAAAAARKLGGSVQAEVTAQREAAAAAKRDERNAARESERQGNRGASSGGSGAQVVNNYILYGEHFYSESNRMRQLDAITFVQSVTGGGFVEHS